jgi:hypothetical protein
LSQIIELFICDEYNTEKAYEILKEKYNVIISKQTIYKINKEIRNIIYKYMLFVYYSEPLGEMKEGGFYSVDETYSIITTTHKSGFGYH